MKINELIRGQPKKIKHGNGGKLTIQYSDDVPDLANPVARSMLALPHLRQRSMPSKKHYNRKKKDQAE